jgi:hypothetical protein
VAGFGSRPRISSALIQTNTETEVGVLQQLGRSRRCVVRVFKPAGGKLPNPSHPGEMINSTSGECVKITHV